jgi:hypothetical protein
VTPSPKRPPFAPFGAPLKKRDSKPTRVQEGLSPSPKTVEELRRSWRSFIEDVAGTLSDSTSSLGSDDVGTSEQPGVLRRKVTKEGDEFENVDEVAVHQQRQTGDEERKEER